MNFDDVRLRFKISQAESCRIRGDTHQARKYVIEAAQEYILNNYGRMISYEEIERELDSGSWR